MVIVVVFVVIVVVIIVIKKRLKMAQSRVIGPDKTIPHQLEPARVHRAGHIA